ncbi:MAG TPA: NosD domain-containing protein [Thermoanaerobaculia bacterium]|jgi:CSLREA domain-containing protein|nr:NosD domain-containing protein [Thermoanaerobaculia bacterium]
MRAVIAVAVLSVLVAGGPLAAVTFTVNNVGDQPDANTADNVCSIAGQPTICTLRAAIQQANATAGTDTIAFSITGAGPHVFAPGSALPSFTQAVIVDGTTEPSYAQFAPVVVINGAGAGAGVNGLVFAAGSNGSTLRGVVVQGFGGNGVVVQSDGCTVERTYSGTNNVGTTAAGNTGAGFLVSGNSNTLGVSNDSPKRILASANGGGGVVITGSSNALHSSHVGTNLGGSAALGNTGAGVAISGSSNTLNHNLVSGNSQEGVRITAGSGNVVGGNHLIGMNATGTAALPNGGDGVSIQGGTGNTIGDFNTISGNSGNGVSISGASTTGNVVRSNFIGTAVSGTTALPNAMVGVLLSATVGNTVGGTAAGAGNVISGNGGIGVRVASGSGNFIQSNDIGTNPSGNGAIANGGTGITVEGSPNTTVGGGEGDGNLVSGNVGSGIVVSGAANGTIVIGNTVGTAVAGTPALPNTVDGIALFGTSGVIVGGDATVGSDNVVSGNGRHGIYVSGGSGNQIRINEIGTDGLGTTGVGNAGHGLFLENTSTNTVDTSLISANHLDGVRISGGNANTLTALVVGVDVTGMTALGNWGNGLTILNATNTVIGQSVGGKGNTFSGNLQSGIVISGAGSFGNTIHNTLIGPNTADSANIGNGGWGVLIAGSVDNTIGGPLSVDANRIRGNGVFFNAANGGNGTGGIGILSGNGNEIRHNLISGNYGLGIDLDADGALPFDGISANDASDADNGANLLQNRPVITSATIGAGNTAVAGTLTSTPNTTFDIEIYTSSRCDPSGAGEGTSASATVSTTTNGSGQASWSSNFAQAPAGSVFTAVATDPNGNSSEFSNCVPIYSGAPIEFDGDPASEIFVFSGGAWTQFDYTTGSQTSSVWTGTGTGCRQVMMDYDGDGRDDLTQLCGGAWHFFNDNGSYNKGIWVGDIPGNLPVPADYDGDGRDDVVVYNNGSWSFFDFQSGNYQASRSRFTGSGAGQIPAPIDYDGDGKAELSVYNGGAWHFFDEAGAYVKGIWVGPGAFPVPGDYDGDGHDDAMIFRDGVWSYYDFATGAYVPGKSVYTGTPPHISGGTTTPEPLDVDGNGTLDFTLFAGGPWHFYNANGTYAKGIWTGGVGEKPLSARPQQ